MPSLPKIEVVLTNWKRPGNLPMIVSAFRRQTVPVLLTLIDNATCQEDTVASEVAAQVDQYIRIINNPYGPFVRYASQGFYDADHLFFPDDDMIPGSRCVEHFAGHASAEDSYGVLGQLGRILSHDNYVYDDIKRAKDQFVHVDLCIRAYFVRSSILDSVHVIKKEISFRGWKDLLWEDDMILAAGCRLAGRDVVLTPTSNDPESSVCVKELDSSFALSARPDRIARRGDAWRRLGLILADLKSLNQSDRF